MPSPINIKELIADREAGGLGPFSDSRPMLVRHSPIAHANYSTDEGSANARRIARLPTLEAAYIEAVGVLREIERRTTAHPDDNGSDDKRDKRIAHSLARKFLGDTE